MHSATIIDVGPEGVERPVCREACRPQISDTKTTFLYVLQLSSTDSSLATPPVARKAETTADAAGSSAQPGEATKVKVCGLFCWLLHETCQYCHLRRHHEGSVYVARRS